MEEQKEDRWDTLISQAEISDTREELKAKRGGIKNKIERVTFPMGALAFILSAFLIDGYVDKKINESGLFLQEPKKIELVQTYNNLAEAERLLENLPYATSGSERALQLVRADTDSLENLPEIQNYVRQEEIAQADLVTYDSLNDQYRTKFMYGLGGVMALLIALTESLPGIFTRKDKRKIKGLERKLRKK